MTKYSKDLLIFFVLFFICGIFGLIFLQSPDYDFFSYHHYNAWAFLNERLSLDFMTAGIRTYFNPYLDVVQYFFINLLNTHPYIFHFLSSFNVAVGFFILYKICYCLISENYKKRFLPFFLIIVYVFFTPVMYEVSSPYRHDMFIADIVLLVFYILIKNIFLSDAKKRNLMILLSGCLMGACVGLKLTAFIYGITFAILFLFFKREIKGFGKTFVYFVAGMVLGFLVVDGYWLYKIYVNFQNPFLPYFNNIFHSPYSDNNLILNDDYSHIQPKNLLSLIFYPFIMADVFNTYGLYCGFDYRYALGIVCILYLGFVLRKNTVKTYLKDIVNSNNQLYFTLLFVFLSYYLNTFVFGNYRYITATGMLFGVILFVTLYIVCRLLKTERLLYILFVAFFLVLTCNSDYEKFPRHINADDNIIYYEDYKFRDNSYVIIGTPYSSVAAVKQNKSVKYIGFTFPKVIYDDFYDKYLIREYGQIASSMYYDSEYLQTLLKDILHKSNSAVYIVIRARDFDGAKDYFNSALNYYSGSSGKLEKCRIVNSKYDNVFALVLCEYCLH